MCAELPKIAPGLLLSAILRQQLEAIFAECLLSHSPHHEIVARRQRAPACLLDYSRKRNASAVDYRFRLLFVPSYRNGRGGLVPSPALPHRVPR